MTSVTLAGVLLLANVGSNLGVDGISTVQHDAYESAVNVPPSGHQRAASDASMVCARHHASNPLHAVQNTLPGSRGTSGATLSAALASNSGLLSLTGHRRAVTHASVSGRAIVKAILHESLNFDFTAPNGTSSGAEVEYPTFVAQCIEAGSYLASGQGMATRAPPVGGTATARLGRLLHWYE